MTRWFLILSLVTACGSAPVASVTTPEVPVPPTLPARLVRQPSATRDLRVSLYLEADGAHRAVSGDGRELVVTDPFTRTAYVREPIPFVYDASLDPSFTTACVELREMRAGAPTEIGAFDLVHRVWRWREVLITEGEDGTVARLLATPERCAAIVRTRTGDTLVVRALDTGAVLESDAPIFETLPDTSAMWSDDRSTLVLARPASTPSGESAYYLDVRDGRTLAQRAVIWARCVEVGETVRIAIDERIESEARRAYLGRTLPELLGACETGPTVPAQVPESMALPSPWALLSDDVVAAHDETGFYLWDHAHHASPRRLEAPPLVRYDDVNGQSRPYELVVPPDASWVGIVREDATLVRFSATDGAPLSEVALPRLNPSEVLSVEDAQWQVFAGARDRLLAIRGVNGHRKVFVGDVSGHWTRARCRVFPMIVQAVEHEDATGTWLVSDPHYGLSRVDEATGLVTASFLPTDTWSRVTTAIRSPDGTELFVGVAASESDDVGGLYFLDAATLAVVRRFPVGLLTAAVEDVEWTREGVVLALHAGFVVETAWGRIDPLTGAGEVIAHGPMAIDWAPTRRGATHLLHAFEGGVFLSRDHRDFRRLELVEGGAVIDEADGRTWCEGAGCELYRCVVGAREVRPATDAACADQRVR